MSIYTRKPALGAAILDRRHPINQNLAAWYLFNEGGGQTLYDLVGENHGALTNGPAWDSSPRGGSLNFDAVDDYVDISVLSPTTTYSLSFRFRSLGSDSYGGVITENTNTGVFCRGGSELMDFFYSGSDHNTPGGELIDGFWYHYVLSVDAGSVSQYVDGIVKATSSSAPAWDFEFIGRSSLSSESYGGRLDDLRIYPGRALSQGDVLQLGTQPYAGLVQRRDQVYFLPAGSVQPGAGASSITFTSAAGGASLAAGAGAALLDFTAPGVGASLHDGVGSTSLDFTSAGVGAALAGGAGASILDFIAAGGGASLAAGPGSSALTFTVSGVGSIIGLAPGAGSSSLTFTTAGVGAARSSGIGASTLTFTTAASGLAAVPGAGTSSLTFTPLAVGSSLASGGGASIITFAVPGVGSALAGGAGSSTVTFVAAGVGASLGLISAVSMTLTATVCRSATLTATVCRSQTLRSQVTRTQDHVARL